MGKVGKGLWSDGNLRTLPSFPVITFPISLPFFLGFLLLTHRDRETSSGSIFHTLLCNDHICDHASKTQDHLMCTALYSLQSTFIDMISPDTYNSFFNSIMTGGKVSRSHSEEIAGPKFAANLSIFPLHVEAWMLVQALAHTCVHPIPYPYSLKVRHA